MSASYRQKQATIEHMNSFGRSQSQPVLREFGDDDFSRSESEEELKLSQINEVEDYEVEDVRASVDQDTIDKAWIQGLSVNFPLKTYYQTLKVGMGVLLRDTNLPNASYPEWSENLFETFKELTKAVPEMHMVYYDLGLNENNIT